MELWEKNQERKKTMTCQNLSTRRLLEQIDPRSRELWSIVRFVEIYDFEEELPDESCGLDSCHIQLKL